MWSNWRGSTTLVKIMDDAHFVKGPSAKDIVPSASEARRLILLSIWRTVSRLSAHTEPCLPGSWQPEDILSHTASQSIMCLPCEVTAISNILDPTHRKLDKNIT